MAAETKVLGYLLCIAVLSGGCTVSGSLIGKFVPQKVSLDGSTLNILNQPRTVMFTRDAKPVPPNEITSIISLALGFSVPKELSWKGLLSGNPFDRPEAALMITVDSLPKDQSLQTTSTKSIEVQSFPNDESKAQLLAVSSSRTLSSHLSEIYDGEAFTLSLSANEDLAAAGYSDGKNSETLVWSDKQNAWIMLSDKSPKGAVIFTKDQILLEMQNIFKTKGVRFHPKKNQIIVKLKNDEVKFDLNKKADFLFFSELAVTQLIYSKIASMSRIINDGIPDVYMISIASLKDLQKKYGANSEQVHAAIHVLEKFISEITDKFVTLYNGNILAVQLSVKTSEDDISPDMPHSKEIYHKVKSHLGNSGIEDFYIRFQELHVPNDIENHVRKTLCEQMSGAMSGFGVNMKFKCASELESHRISRSLLALKNEKVDVDTVNLASEYRSDFPVIFNMWFWLLVVLFLAVYIISLVMWYMDPGRDSVIYRMTSQGMKTE